MLQRVRSVLKSTSVLIEYLFELIAVVLQDLCLAKVVWTAVSLPLSLVRIVPCLLLFLVEHVDI